jgi:hypothetical protein
MCQYDTETESGAELLEMRESCRPKMDDKNEVKQ